MNEMIELQAVMKALEQYRGALVVHANRPLPPDTDYDYDHEHGHRMGVGLALLQFNLLVKQIDRIALLPDGSLSITDGRKP